MSATLFTILNPPHPPGGVSNKDTMGGLGQVYGTEAKLPFPPIDLPYAAALIRERGVDLEAIDCPANGWEGAELLDHLGASSPEMVAIRTSTPTVEWDLKLARLLKRLTGTTIVLFGPHVGMYPDDILAQEAVDGIVIGEAEETLAELAAAGAPGAIAGLWYRSGDEVVKNPARPPIEELDRLPFPAWDLLPYRAYEGDRLMRETSPFVTMQTSRGCPYSCTYCPYPVTQGRKLRVRTPASVVDEIQWLVEKLGVKAVLFRDPEFAMKRERVLGICEEIRRRAIAIAWRCETRIEDLDEELVAEMGKAGCIGINMGIETIDEAVLRNVERKRPSLATITGIVRACMANDVEPFCFFVLGLPGETRETAMATIRYALELEPTFLQFTIATPYPGTKLRAWAEEKGYIEAAGFAGFSSYDAVMRNESLSLDELRWLQWYAHEARDLKPGKVVRRVLSSGKRGLNELTRWARFRRVRPPQAG